MLLALVIAVSAQSACSILDRTPTPTYDQLFGCLDTVTVKQQDVETILDKLAVVLDGYVFLDILKNPPQPTFNANYYTPADLLAELKAISREEKNIFDFNLELQNLVLSAHDNHLNIAFNPTDLYKNSLGKLYVNDVMYVLPFSINIDMDGKVYAVPFLQYPTLFPDDEVYNKINALKDVPLASINGLSPIEYLRERTKFSRMKSPHAKFTEVVKSLTLQKAIFSSMTRDALKEQFVLVHEGQETPITAEFRFRYYGAVEQSAKSAEQQLLFDIMRNSDSSDEVVPLLVRLERSLVASEQSATSLNAEGVLMCYDQYDDDSRVNLMVINSFNPQDASLFIETLVGCVKLFDTNDKPIAIVTSMNGGGLVLLEQLVSLFINNAVDTNYPGAARHSELITKFIKTFGVIDARTCVPWYNDNGEVVGNWFDAPVTDMFGDVAHVRTKTGVMPQFLDMSDELMQTVRMEHQRKPTDILIYTDGYCFSACSMLAKKARRQGLAVLVGYAGDPVSLDPFDAGQSPTSVVPLNSADKIDENVDTLNAYGVSVALSWYETYQSNYAYNESVPGEFYVDPVDIRSSIFTFTNYSIFTKDAYEKWTHFQTKCNPDNDVLVLEDDACDSQMQDKNTFGGHPCKADGTWDTTKCVPSHCRVGYVFDYQHKVCRRDVCAIPDVEGGSSESASKTSSQSQRGHSSESSSDAFMASILVAISFFLWV